MRSSAALISYERASPKTEDFGWVERFGVEVT